MAEPLAFYFDFISPYAYLAWHGVHRLAEKHGRSVTPVPILFASLLNAHGHKGPAEIEPKRLYTGKHVMRLGHDHGLRLVPPPVHPFNPLLPLRVACLAMPAADKRRLITAIYDAIWAEGGGVHDEPLLARALTAAGFDAAALIAEAKTDAVKLMLREQSDRALALGCFGVPTIVADGELFWGFDAFPHIDRFLAGKDPIDPVQLEKWKKAVVSGAKRI